MALPGIAIGGGINIGGGISIGANSNLIPAGSLTVQGGLISYFSPTLYFFTQGLANAFYAANPSIFYVVFAGTQTKYDGVTLGAVTPSGPYWSITASGGTITVGYLLIRCY